DLATLHVRGEQVDRLDAGLEHLGLGLQLVELRRLAVDRPALGDLQGLPLWQVERLTGDVEDLALGDVAHGHGDGGTGVAHLAAADQADGGLQCDRAHQVVAQVLGGLQGDLGLLAAEIDRGLQRVVHLRNRVRRELDVQHGPDHAGNPAHARLAGCGCRSLVCSSSHDDPSVWFEAQLAAMASAPETISLISWVISACRAWLASRVYLRMMSSALSTAVCMARCRAASSEAAACSRALNMRLRM